ncbi:hypothetical protein CALVIDRAFT_566298 [Calocera viscosa TUFC12733]|uniref:Uncharacterized protein n=1 Tax=Calocera viscosa (strain TUFC12733) TaxID=1330018 RepID=A0A167JRH3_CALVF|nr:hypothetical protein CALVIDRAFT_566298 [Calocera viscosa TUFC12733]
MSAPPNAEVIAARAEEHQAVLDELSTLEYAPSALKDNESAISSLTTRINDATAKIAVLHKKTKHEHKDFAKLQNSAGRRMWVKIKHGGKQEALEKKLAKEEREFLEALEEEQNAEEARTGLEKERESLQAQNPELQQKAGRHQLLRTRLDLLYRSVFEGFTPDYPYEDEAEEMVRQAEDANANFQTIVNRESQVMTLLANAKTCLNNCVNLLYQAQGWNYNDMFGGGLFSDLFENNALIDAKAYACRGQALVQEAKKKQPLVVDINDVDVAQLDFLVNIVFDNVFTDIMFAQRIQDSLRSVNYGLQRVEKDLNACNQRLAQANSSVRRAVASLTQRRRELEEIRRTILQSLHNHTPVPQIYTEQSEAPEEQLPAYERVAKTPLAASTPSATLSPSSVYSPPPTAPLGSTSRPSSRPNSRPTTPQPQSRPVTPNGVYPQNPYASALLARARDQGTMPDTPQADRSVSQMIRDRRANAGVSAIAQEKNYI